MQSACQSRKVEKSLGFFNSAQQPVSKSISNWDSIPEMRRTQVWPPFRPVTDRPRLYQITPLPSTRCRAPIDRLRLICRAPIETYRNATAQSTFRASTYGISDSRVGADSSTSVNSIPTSHKSPPKRRKRRMTPPNKTGPSYQNPQITWADS